MFNKIIRLYNQNRRKFWTIIAIIVVGLLLLRLANYLAKLSLERQNNATPTNTTTTNSQTYSIISDKTEIIFFKVLYDKPLLVFLLPHLESLYIYF